jgi:DNA-binding XRE family transcriptional regulator
LILKTSLFKNTPIHPIQDYQKNAMTHHAQSTETSHNATNTNRKEMRRNARMGQTRYSTKIDASKMTVGQKYSENGKEYVWVGKETLRLIDKYIVENIESLAAEAGIPYPRRGRIRVRFH